MLVHLIYIPMAFYRDAGVFTGDFCEKQWRSGQIEQPLNWLQVTDFYYFPLFILSPAAEQFLKIDGTGGPCTYVSVNPALPYSLVFIVTSSLVYYLIGLFIGIVVEDCKKRKLVKLSN